MHGSIMCIYTMMEDSDTLDTAYTTAKSWIQNITTKMYLYHYECVIHIHNILLF